MRICSNLTILIFLLATCFSKAASKELVLTDIPQVGALRSSTVHTFCMDQNRILWIGTNKEIIAFDGNNAISVALFDDNNIPLRTNAFLPLPDVQMLAGTNNGLYLIDFKKIGHPETKIIDHFGKDTKTVLSLANGSNDSILVGTDRGLYTLSSALAPNFEPQLPTLKINALTVGNDAVYIGTDRGIYLMDNAGKSLRRLVDGYNASALLLDGSTLYAGSDADGMIAINTNNGNFTQIEMPSTVIRQLAKDATGTIYIATDGEGLLSLEPGSLKAGPLSHSHLKSNDIHNNQIYSVYVDKRGRLYVGFYLMGAEYSLSATEDFQFSSITANLGEASVRAIFADGNNLLVGTRNGAVHADKSEIIRHLSKNQLRSGLVLSINKFNGKYLIGTYGGGLSVYDPTSGEVEPYHKDFTRGSIFSICQDSPTTAWLGTSAGLCRIGPNGPITYISCNAEGDSLSNVYSVFIDSRGRGWASTSLNTYQFDLKSNTLTTIPHIKDRDVRQIYETRNHDLWMVTNAGKISVYTSDLQTSDINAVVSSVADARGVVEDAKGNVWITTTNGLHKYSPDKDALLTYGYADGIPTPLFNSGAPVVASDGKLYLCHTAGLLTADTKSLSDGSLNHFTAAPAFISDYHGQRMAPAKDTALDAYVIELPTAQSLIKIALSDGSFAGNEIARYEFSMDKGKTWQRIASDMKLQLDIEGKKQTNISIRQIGNPLTTTKVIVKNPVGHNYLLWIEIALILIGIAGFFVWRKHHKHAPVLVPVLAEVATNIETEEETPESSSEPLEDAEPEAKKYAANSISDKECEKIAKNLKNLLQENKLYIDPDLKISTLAEKLDISSHKLSYVFSQYLKTTYYDYIYKYRVDEFKRLALADKKRAYTLIALSEKAGFNSRATFFRAFKKFEGLTPGDYLKTLRGED